MAALLCRFPSASSSRLLSPFSRASKPRSLLLAVSPIMYSTLGPNYSSYSVAAAASASAPIALPSDAREPPPSLGEITRPDLPILHQIVLTVAEHHSAIVPWQIVAKKTGAVLKYVGLTKEEVPDLDQFMGLLSKNTKLVVAHHISNVLGSVLPIDEIMVWSRNVGAKVLVDASQSAPHMVVDVQKLDVDFLVASSHKMCGPTGVGFLYGKIKLLSSMPPFLGGGEMISDVFQDYSTYAEPPSRDFWAVCQHGISFLC